MIINKCPCTQDCAFRSQGCRGTCQEFKAYEKKRFEGYAERDRARSIEEQLSQFNSPSYRRLAHYYYKVRSV